MEKTSKIILLAVVTIMAVIGLSAVAYAQTTRASTGGQCGSMMASGGMGGAGYMGMMGQSTGMQTSCQSMMDQHDAAQCQNMVSQNMAQCQEIMRQQNMTQVCH